MAFPFFLAALFGKAAVGAVAKGVAGKAAAGLVAKGVSGKAGAVGAKAMFGHHAHHKLAKYAAQKAIEETTEAGIRSIFFRRRRKKDESES